MIPLQANATEERPVKCAIGITSKAAWLLTRHLSMIINVAAPPRPNTEVVQVVPREFRRIAEAYGMRDNPGPATLKQGTRTFEHIHFTANPSKNERGGKSP